uniref:Putative ovule protein n=1 Tax=Solanum chacoense TaxID=4108 RepID=A0A0V0HFU0_SOLCH
MPLFITKTICPLLADKKHTQLDIPDKTTSKCQSNKSPIQKCKKDSYASEKTIPQQKLLVLAVITLLHEVTVLTH